MIYFRIATLVIPAIGGARNLRDKKGTRIPHKKAVAILLLHFLCIKIIPHKNMLKACGKGPMIANNNKEQQTGVCSQKNNKFAVF